MTTLALWTPDIRPRVEWMLDSILYDDGFGTISPWQVVAEHPDAALLRELQQAGLYRPIETGETLWLSHQADLVPFLRHRADFLAAHAADDVAEAEQWRTWSHWRREVIDSYVEPRAERDLDEAREELRTALARQAALEARQVEDAGSSRSGLAAAQQQSAARQREIARLQLEKKRARMRLREAGRGAERLEAQQALEASTRNLADHGAAERAYHQRFPEVNEAKPERAAIREARRTLQLLQTPRTFEAIGQRCYDKCVDARSLSSKDSFYDFLYAAKLPASLIEPLIRQVGMIPYFRGDYETFLFAPRPLIEDVIRALAADWVMQHRGDETEWIPTERLDTNGQGVLRRSDQGRNPFEAPESVELRAILPRPGRDVDPKAVLDFRVKHEDLLRELREHLAHLTLDLSRGRASKRLGADIDRLARATADEMKSRWPALRTVVRRLRLGPAEIAGATAAEMIVAAVAPEWQFAFSGLALTGSATKLIAEAAGEGWVENSQRKRLAYLYQARSFGVL